MPPLAIVGSGTKRLIALLVLVCLTAALVRLVALSPRSSSSSTPRVTNVWSSTRHEPVQPNLDSNADPPAPHPDRIHGRWEAARASLGLPPPPSHQAHAVTPTPDATWSRRLERSDKRASRFDLGGKRRLADEAARRLPPLRFAHDDMPSARSGQRTAALHVTTEKRSSPAPSARPADM